ncbi:MULTISPECIES: TetR/AcrR family transcriptional regulator [Nonomuraea]|uniref:TetR/AcrR family transcriptional regulator n=1 Tax=Nonomuraea TaxID=83681 RepID=UPI001C5CCE50|nr:TetR/AcrR family transcriptional regulator [Nonomuraea ceibae]
MPASRSKSRTDAERNRARVLEVARELFAELGDQVQMAEVAKAADVGIGTVYRHFPTRQALVEAAAQHRFAEILDFARERCLAAPDPGVGLDLLLTGIGEVLAKDRGLSGAIESAMGSAEPSGDSRTALEGLAGTLLDRGRAAGSVRDDATVTDVYMIVCGLAAVIRTGSGDWRRFVRLALDALRSGRPSSPTG